MNCSTKTAREISTEKDAEVLLAFITANSGCQRMSDRMAWSIQNLMGFDRSYSISRGPGSIVKRGEPVLNQTYARYSRALGLLVRQGKLVKIRGRALYALPSMTDWTSTDASRHAMDRLRFVLSGVNTAIRARWDRNNGPGPETMRDLIVAALDDVPYADSPPPDEFGFNR